jgi:hypothetical protein
VLRPRKEGGLAESNPDACLRRKCDFANTNKSVAKVVLLLLPESCCCCCCCSVFSLMPLSVNRCPQEPHGLTVVCCGVCSKVAACATTWYPPAAPNQAQRGAHGWLPKIGMICKAGYANGTQGIGIIKMSIQFSRGGWSESQLHLNDEVLETGMASAAGRPGKQG